MARFWWARHGQCDANVTHTFSHRRYDPPLTALGRQQAGELAERVAGFGLAQVFCSPLLRARETAQTVTERLGLPGPRVLDGLCELDIGSLEGRSDAAAWQIHDDVHAAWAAGDLEARFPDGESRLSLLARLTEALSEVAQSAAETSGGVLLVAHGGNVRAALPGWGVPEPEHGLPNTGLAELGLALGSDGVLEVALLSWEG